MNELTSFCHIEVGQILKELHTSKNGLSDEEGNIRLKQYGTKIHTQRRNLEVIIAFNGAVQEPYYANKSIRSFHLEFSRYLV